VESLTGQRHENSVLFSLSNLQSLAMPAAKPVTTASSGPAVTEGSGLIDIRQMAASTLGTSSNGPSSFGSLGAGGPSPVDDLPAFGAFSPAAPVLLPLPSSSGPPKWVYFALILGLVAVAGIGFMAYKVMTTKAPELVERVEQVPAPEQPKPAVAAAPAEPKKPSTIAEENLPPREGSPEAKAADKGEREHEHHHGKGHDHESKKAAADEKKGDSKPVAAAEPIVKKPPPGSLDALIDDASPAPKKGGGGGGRAKPGADEDAKPAGPLAKSAVVAGMNSVKPKVAACYSEFKVQGMAMVNVVIAKSGKVSSATVTGKFAGTPTGACVEKAVKSASFPPSDGLQTPYPFQLK
jgi:hypothetical protein